MSQTDTLQAGPDLVLTMSAVDRLRTLLEESGDTHCKLRIHADGTADAPAFTLSLEESANDDDIELDYARIAVLLDPESHRRLRGHEVDHRHDDSGEHFVIRRA